jgi:hypothetical protein
MEEAIADRSRDDIDDEKEETEEEAWQVLTFKL